ncbi:NUDIX hydrolase [Aestuariibaculum suncheonense]|uniref:NUDIX domain-containing protein n=1 Tax=Aestuariibaculum suncheonense TaxID=1028745 RepID=A0A8J6UKJ2_9FLAO|nr:NUDIX domain-containing protein [Aestuariibaculum suncheonense]MBD0835741.1 NUDIX domain-containing protein [Aestuariibaculum suncheonense]
MDEYIDIVDANGIPTGKTELKSVIHQKGYFHNTVHIWFYTKNGDILLSQRSAKKSICPLMWDVSVAGHIDAGESIEQAALRETKEEIGLIITESDLQKIGMFQCFQSYDSDINDNEFHHTYICELKQSLSTLIPQEEEVEALKLVSLNDFQYFIDYIGIDNHFVPSNKKYYEVVLETIVEVVN